MLGSLAVLTIFRSSLAVALVTVVTIMCGVTIGVFMLRQMMPVNFKYIFTEGFLLIKSRLCKVLFPGV